MKEERIARYVELKAIEKEVAADCVNKGSYDKVVYCTCCTPAVELSREAKVIEALGHDWEIIEQIASFCECFSRQIPSCQSLLAIVVPLSRQSASHILRVGSQALRD